LHIPPKRYISDFNPWSRLGSEFMPPLDEGSILFMGIFAYPPEKVYFRLQRLFLAEEAMYVSLG
jgi:hypothetical protein